MKMRFLATLALCMAGTPLLAGEQPILPLVVHDGVYFDASEFDGGMELTVAGPDDFYHQSRTGKSEPVFLDIANVDGKSLADGLYDYDLRLTPAKLVNRAHMTAAEQANHRRLYGQGLPSISGSFRVVDGAILDPYEGEE